MNKQGLRAFAFGIIFTVSILGTYYFNYANESQAKFDETAAKKQLQKKGYIVLTDAEYQNMEKRLTGSHSAATKAKDQKAVNSQNNHANESKISTYTLKVASGMSSGEIAKLLEEHKIIENGDEFGQFLVAHQFQTKIQLGTYRLTNQMDYQEIAGLITKSKP